MTVPIDSVWWSIFWWAGDVGKYRLYSRACKTCSGMKAKLPGDNSYLFFPFLSYPDFPCSHPVCCYMF